MNTGRIIVTAFAASILAIPAMAEAPGYFAVPGTETTLKVYGQVELRNQDLLNGGTDLTARSGDNEDKKQTGVWDTSYRGRIGVTTTTPSALGDVTAKVEGQFNSKDEKTTGASFNLRHAYFTIGGFLAGQTDSLYGYGAFEPNTLWGVYSDENGSYDRVRQVRYVFEPTKGLEIGAAIESINANSKGTSGAKAPNFVATFAYGGDWGGVAASLSFQKKENWSLPGGDRKGTGTSIMVSGGWNITSNDVLTLMYNNAGGNYGSGNDGFAPDASKADGFLFYKSTAINVAFGHTWNDAFSSNIGLGMVTWKKDLNVVPVVDVIEAAGQDYTLNEMWVNTYYQATKTVKFGIEYQMGTTKSKDTNAYNTKAGDNTANKIKDSKLRFLMFAKFF